MYISMTPIGTKDVGKIVNPHAFSNVYKEVQRMQDETEKLMRQPTSTWRHKPGFEQGLKSRGDDLVGEVFTTDGPYLWLNDGTKERHAILSRNWQSKTSPGSLQSGAGRGYVRAVRRNYSGDPIQARKWTDVIVKIIDQELQKAIEAALAKI